MRVVTHVGNLVKHHQMSAMDLLCGSQLQNCVNEILGWNCCCPMETHNFIIGGYKVYNSIQRRFLVVS